MRGRRHSGHLQLNGFQRTPERVPVHAGHIAAVQVHNLHLLRGLIGRPGCGIYQLNGQPTAQNTRECGADGDLPGFRNWGNQAHIQELAELWNVHPDQIPHWSPPTHAMQISRYCETGSIKLLWISGTDPLVSLLELGRIRKIIQKEDLFVIAQDAFPTETTQYADVVLPAAIWDEKTGCFTNVDRTVHLSLQAIDPPGEARSELDIFVDYSRRMDFRGQDGSPLLSSTWQNTEDAFEAWKKCTKGRPYDYTGLSYAKLTGSPDIQGPCNDQFPNGTPHLYTDGVFNTSPERCETYGHDLVTGGPHSEQEYKLSAPGAGPF